MALDKEEIVLKSMYGVKKFSKCDVDELKAYAIAYTIIEELERYETLTSSDKQTIFSIAENSIKTVHDSGMYTKPLMERLKLWYDNNFGKTYQDYIKSAEVHSYLARYCCRPMDKKSFRTIFGELLLAIRG